MDAKASRAQQLAQALLQALLICHLLSVGVPAVFQRSLFGAVSLLVDVVEDAAVSVQGRCGPFAS